MTDFDPSALRRLAARAASSPRGVFPGVGIAAFSGALNAAARWAQLEGSYIGGARMLGMAESDARTVLDEVVAERRALGLDAVCEDTFRASRKRLYARLFNTDADTIPAQLTGTLFPADIRAAGIRFEWEEQR